MQESFSISGRGQTKQADIDNVSVLLYQWTLHIVVSFKVPDNLVDEVVRVLSREHGQNGPCWHTLLKADQFGICGEDRRLVHILNRNGYTRCGLKWWLDAACQVGLVGHHHSQHEGTVHLKINWLEGSRWGGREKREREWWEEEISAADYTIGCNRAPIWEITYNSVRTMWDPNQHTGVSEKEQTCRLQMQCWIMDNVSEQSFFLKEAKIRH